MFGGIEASTAFDAMSGALICKTWYGKFVGCLVEMDVCVLEMDGAARPIVKTSVYPFDCG